MAFEQYKFTQTRQVQPADMSEARVWETLANTMDRFSAQMGSINNANAARAKGVRNAQDSLEGMQAGTIAGSEGALEFMEAGNPYADSYNKGILASYESSISNQISETLNTSFENNPLDADAYATDALALDKVLTQGKGDFEVALIRQTLDRITKSHQTKISSNLQVKVRGEQTAEILLANKNNFKEMEDMAYNGEDVSQVMSNYIIRTENGIDAGLLSPESVAKERTILEDTLTLRQTEGAFDRLLTNDGIAAATAALQEYKDDPTSIDAPLADNQNLINDLEREIQTAQATAEIKVKAAIKEFEAGNFSLDIEALSKTVKGTSLEAPLINAQAISEDSAKFRKLNFVQMDMAEQKINAMPDSTVKETLLKNFADIRKHTKEMLEKDPYALATETGVVSGSPFDLTDPTSLQARVAEAEAASNFYRVKVPPLSQAEADALRFTINEGNVQDNMAVFQQIGEGFGSQADEVYKLMFKEGGGAFAAASGMMLQGDEATTQLILKGQDLLKNNIYPDIAKVTDKDQPSIDSIIDAAFDGAYIETPNQIDILRSGIKSVYAQLMAESGNYSSAEGHNPKLLELAIDRVTGGIVELEWDESSGLIAGILDEKYSIEVPRAGMTAENVEDWLASITPEDIDSMGGVTDMDSEEVALIINQGRARLYSVGHGEYTLRNMTGNYFTTTGADGEPTKFVLTYTTPNSGDNKRVIGVTTDLRSDISAASTIGEQVLNSIDLGSKVVEDDPIDEMEADIIGDEGFLNLRNQAGELEDQFQGGATDTTSFIKAFEDLKLTAYYATEYEKQKGTVSVGYGSTRRAKEGETITEAQAEAYLKEDIKVAELAISKLVKVDLTPRQHTALTSLVFNIGAGNFRASKALKELNKGNMEGFLFEAFDSKQGFVKQGNKILKGLVKRRAKERALFESGTA